jgi:hypothetical protein
MQQVELKANGVRAIAGGNVFGEHTLEMVADAGQVTPQIQQHADHLAMALVQAAPLSRTKGLLWRQSSRPRVWLLR